MLREKFSSFDNYTSRRFILALIACLALTHLFHICLNLIFPTSINLQHNLSDQSINHIALNLSFVWTIADLNQRGLFRATTLLGWSRGRCALIPLILALTVSAFLSLSDLLGSDNDQIPPVTVSAHCVDHADESALYELDERDVILLQLHRDSPLCKTPKNSHHHLIADPLSRGQIRSITPLSDTHFILSSTHSINHLITKIFVTIARLLYLVFVFGLFTYLSATTLLATLTSLFCLACEALFTALL